MDLFILRPHGCYLINQHLNFNQFDNSSDPVVVTLTTNDDGLITRIHHFIEDVDNPLIKVTMIPQDVWLSLVNRLTGQHFNHFDHVEDIIFDGGFIIKYYDPTLIDDDFEIRTYDADDDSYHYSYSSQFDIKEFISVVSVDTILKQL